MAHALGMTVVGEGIETATALHNSPHCPCDTGQGYPFTEALPPPKSTNSGSTPPADTRPTAKPTRPAKGSNHNPTAHHDARERAPEEDAAPSARTAMKTHQAYQPPKIDGACQETSPIVAKRLLRRHGTNPFNRTPLIVAREREPAPPPDGGRNHAAGKHGGVDTAQVRLRGDLGVDELRRVEHRSPRGEVAAGRGAGCRWSRSAPSRRSGVPSGRFCTLRSRSTYPLIAVERSEVGRAGGGGKPRVDRRHRGPVCASRHLRRSPTRPLVASMTPSSTLRSPSAGCRTTSSACPDDRS